MFPYDFRDERMMKQLKEISQRVVAACPEMRRDIAGITHNLLNKVVVIIYSYTVLFSWVSSKEFYFHTGNRYTSRGGNFVMDFS